MLFTTSFLRHFSKSSKWWRWFLGMSVSAGIILGYFAYLHNVLNFTSLMCMLPYQHVSIVGLFCVLSLPLLLSVAAVHFSAYRLLYFIAFSKGITFSYCACYVFAAFGDAGWLVRLLVMFSDSSMLVPLFWFWNRNITGKSDTFRHEVIICGMFALAIGIFDLLVVSPFTVSLFST